MFKCTYFGGTGGCANSVMADDNGITTDCQGCPFLIDEFGGVPDVVVEPLDPVLNEIPF